MVGLSVIQARWQAAAHVSILLMAVIAVVACYVVWVTATDRRRAEGLTRARDEQERDNDALRSENLERKRTEEQLRASEAEFRALAESAPAATLICQDDKIAYSNPARSVPPSLICHTGSARTAGASARIPGRASPQEADALGQSP